jgi:hypothetical protein
MRTIITAVLNILIITGSNLKAQSLDDSAGYNPGIRMMETAKTKNDYLRCAHYFEQLDTLYTDQWLTSYYAGLCYIHASYQVQGNADKDELIDKAQPLIDRAFKSRPGEPEIHVLQAFLYQSRMQINPQLRGMTYSQKADASLKKAVAADTSNPRAFMLMGYNVFYTPAIFGGGAKNALPLFMKAREKYLAFKALLPFYPVWGERENRQMIKKCNQPEN